LLENTSGGSRAVPYGQTDTHDEAVSFRNFANAPKNDTSVFTLFRTIKLVWSACGFILCSQTSNQTQSEASCDSFLLLTTILTPKHDTESLKHMGRK